MAGPGAWPSCRSWPSWPSIALAAFAFIGRPGSPPLRVLVLKPETKPAADAALDLAASGILMASLSTLGSLQGVTPLDPGQAGAVGSPVAAARSAAAEEVLAATVEGLGTVGATLSLRRVRGNDGGVLWAERFVVPTDPKDLRLLADAVAVHLRRAWPDRRTRSGTPALEVRDQDYAELLRLKARLEAGQTTPGAEDLAALDRVVRGSPRFLEASPARRLDSPQPLPLDPRSRPARERPGERPRRPRARPGRSPAAGGQLRLALGRGPAEGGGRAARPPRAHLPPATPSSRPLPASWPRPRGTYRGPIAGPGGRRRARPSWSNLFRLRPACEAGRPCRGRAAAPGAAPGAQSGQPGGSTSSASLELLTGTRPAPSGSTSTDPPQPHALPFHAISASPAPFSAAGGGGGGLPAGPGARSGPRHGAAQPRRRRARPRPRGRGPGRSTPGSGASRARCGSLPRTA